jgi:hydrogenase nickel incorporation protein HypA/HybF
MTRQVLRGLDMHELSIAQSVLEAVEVEAARHPGSRPMKIGLKIGELAAVDPDSLQFAFEVLTRETELEGLKLEIEFCPRRHHCLDCGTEFDVKNFDFRCTKCQSTRNQCISGDELQMAYLELEEHEPSIA